MDRGFQDISIRICPPPSPHLSCALTTTNIQTHHPPSLSSPLLTSSSIFPIALPSLFCVLSTSESSVPMSSTCSVISLPIVEACDLREVRVRPIVERVVSCCVISSWSGVGMRRGAFSEAGGCLEHEDSLSCSPVAAPSRMPHCGLHRHRVRRLYLSRPAHPCAQPCLPPVR